MMCKTLDDGSCQSRGHTLAEECAHTHATDLTHGWCQIQTWKKSFTWSTCVPESAWGILPSSFQDSDPFSCPLRDGARCEVDMKIMANKWFMRPAMWKGFVEVSWMTGLHYAPSGFFSCDPLLRQPRWERTPVAPLAASGYTAWRMLSPPLSF